MLRWSVNKSSRTLDYFLWSLEAPVLLTVDNTPKYTLFKSEITWGLEESLFIGIL